MFIITIPVVYLLGVAAVCSLLGCIVPLPALAAAAALAFPRRTALIVAGVAWVLDQAAGFGWRAYPHTGSTLLWGLALGVATLLAVLGASLLRTSAIEPLRAAGAFVVAFVVYEITLMGASVFLGGWEAYTAPVIGLLAAANAAWFLVSAVGARVLESLRRDRIART